MLAIISTMGMVYGYFEYALFVAVAISGFVGALFAAQTREDAYEAANRQTKWIWVGILLLSGILVFSRMPFLSWAAMVAIGVYWFDVRPHLRSIINNSGGW